jgi:hypothetical protein
MLGQSGSGLDVKVLAKDMEKRFEACPKREMVLPYEREKHKPAWAKLALGPPTDVFADIKPNDSVLYPYLVTIEFKLEFSYGPMRKSKSEAEKDTKLSAIPVSLPSLRGSRYRYIYLVGNDGTRIKTREIFRDEMNGTPGTWGEVTSNPDACWDQIAVK